MSAGIPASMSEVLALTSVVKNYGALRPLRLASLVVVAGERVSIGGVDAGAGELVITLATGASLPDAGEIRLLGKRTSEIVDGDEWLDILERVAIVSRRAVLLEGSTLEQNLALPYTLEIDPVPAAVARRVREIAQRSGIDPERWLRQIAGTLPAEIRVRAHLARALAVEPHLILVEHPTADVEAGGCQALAADFARACAGVAVLMVTNDDAFAKAAAPRNLKLDGATGVLKPLVRKWLTW